VLAFAVLVAIYLPCYFSWGFGKGNVAASLLLAGGIIVGDVIGPAVTGVAGAAAGEALPGGVPPGRIPQAVAELVERAGLAAGGIIVLALAAGLLGASAQVAVRASRHQEF